MDSRYILKTIKGILKKRKITYKQTADFLNLSEAGVKKMFASEDVSLNRLLKICEMVNITLGDLIQVSENRPVKTLKMNREQISFFSKNPDYFFFFLQIANAQNYTDEVIIRNNLTEKSTWKYLKKLDDLKLIKLHSNNKVEHIYQLPLSVDAKGDFFDNLRSEMALHFIKSVHENKKSGGHISIALLTLAPENIEKMKKEIEEIQIAYQRQSEIDKILFSRGDLQEYSFLRADQMESFLPPIPNI